MSKTKFLIISLLIGIILLIMPTVVKAADTYTTTSTINDVTVNWSYKLNDANQIENLKCTNPADLTGNITVPSALDEKVVVTIGDNAFKSATELTGVIIPDSVTSIGNDAFRYCRSLTNVIIPDSVTTIGNIAFSDCDGLTSIIIPNSVTTIGGSSFFASKLEEVIVGKGVTTIEDCDCVYEILDDKILKHTPSTNTWSIETLEFNPTSE